jgi:DNA-binding XRE family transcriptional regulator
VKRTERARVGVEKGVTATAHRLKQVRRELHVSQTIFGKPLGLRQGKVSALEQNDRLPRVLAIALEHIYGVRAEWLLTGKGPKYTEDGLHLCGGSEDGAFDELLAKRPDVMEALRAILGSPSPTPEKKKSTRKAR